MARFDVVVSLLSATNTRIRLILSVALVSIACGVSSPAAGQSTSGFPPFGSFQSGGVDSINQNNLNLHIGIPLFHKAGRGLPVNFMMGYDSSDWSIVYDSTTNRDNWQLLMAGYHLAPPLCSDTFPRCAQRSRCSQLAGHTTTPIPM